MTDADKYRTMFDAWLTGVKMDHAQCSQVKYVFPDLARIIEKAPCLVLDDDGMFLSSMLLILTRIRERCGPLTGVSDQECNPDYVYGGDTWVSHDFLEGVYQRVSPY